MKKLKKFDGLPKTIATYLVFALVIVISVSAVAKALDIGSPVNIENATIENVNITLSGMPGEELGGTSNFDSIALDSNLTVTGTMTITGASTNTGDVTFNGQSILSTGQLSTTTPANMTLAATDLTNYSYISMLPTVGDVTITLPATTTLSALVPNAGDIEQMVIHNATSTAGMQITLAGGTGTLTSNATSTLIMQPLDSALLTFVRKANTDISVILNIFD